MGGRDPTSFEKSILKAADLETLALGANPNADSKNESARTALNIFVGY